MSLTILLKRLLREQSGVALTEYGLIIAGIALALFGAEQGFSYGSRMLWGFITTQTATALSGSSG